MSYAYDFADERPRRPLSILDALKSDLSRTGVGIVNALSSVPRFVQSHMQEYKPGMSVADMPQTMEVLPEAATTATMLPATTGVASVPGISLASGLRRPPPALEVYHGTGVPKMYEAAEGFKPSIRDVGVSTTIDPDIASFHANRLRSEIRPEAMKPRIIPSVADVKSSLKFPAVDPADWTRADAVIGSLEEAARKGKSLPKGMLSDFESIEKQTGGFKKNLIPALKEKGFDSVYFPHLSPAGERLKYNSFLTFDPKQVVPKFSEEGRELVKERGIHPAMKKRAYDADDRLDAEGKLVKGRRGETWQLPKGILKPYSDEMVSGKELLPRFIQRWDEKHAKEIERSHAHKIAVAKKFGVTLIDPSKSGPLFSELARKYGEVVWSELSKGPNF